MTSNSDDPSGASASPFDRVKAELGPSPPTGAAKASAAKSPPGQYVAPIPPNAPPRLNSHRTHGTPSAFWTYRDAANGVRFHIARFDAATGQKVVLPLTLWREGGQLQWAWLAAPAPRLLYGLPDLAEKASAPVLIVEGEKTADAAVKLFPALAVVTWSGGSKAVGKTDWSPLAARAVVIWPDADDAGRKAAEAVARAATAAGAASVAVVDLPAALPKGWDLADPWPPGFTFAASLAAIDAAREAARPAGVEWPWGFRMEPDGLFYDQPGKDGTVAQRLSAPFEVVAEAREDGGTGWAVVIRFKDRDGREKTIAVSRSRLAGGGAEVRAELADMGLIVSPARGKADKFSIALAEVRCTRRITLAGSTGWCGEQFVLPARAIGPPGGEVVQFTGDAKALNYRQKGDLAGWQAEIAARAPGNDLLTFALSMSFAGPLLRPLGLEGGGFHFRGGSSSGKTTLGHAGGSTWGGGGTLGFGSSWRSTGNALEGIAAGHCDCLLVLDELALVAPEEAGGAAYALASGQAKGRSQTSGALRRRVEWCVMILSTGEVSLADHIRASKKGERPMAGQELRLLDIAADGGEGMGVWQTLHGAAGPAALSDSIKAASERHYGNAGPAFVECFVRDRKGSEAHAKEILKGFLEAAREVGDTGQAERAAVRFGVVAVAGELAALWGIVPWPPGAASAAALALFRKWASAFGRGAPREQQEVLRRLRAAILSERSAFSPLGENDTGEDAMPSAGGRDGEARGMKTYGYRWIKGAEVRYYFHESGWLEMTKGFDATEAARMVHNAGFLMRDSGKKGVRHSVKVRGERQKLYCVKSSIIEADLED